MPKYYKIILRYDTAAALNGVNTVLERAEPCLEIDTKRLKIGDGTTPYNALPYFKGDLSQVYTKEEIDGLLENLQGVLTAGSNITIEGNTISATVPTKVSDLTNDSQFVTAGTLADRLAHYWDKDSSYSKAEIDNLLRDVQVTLNSGNGILIDNDTHTVSAKVKNGGHLEATPDGLDIDGSVMLFDEDATLLDEDVEDVYRHTIEEARAAIREVDAAVDSLGAWKDGINQQVGGLAGEVILARGPYSNLSSRLAADEADIALRLMASQLKGDGLIDWTDDTVAPSAKAIVAKVQSLIATAVTGHVSIGGPWSSIASLDEMYVRTGTEYIYDSGMAPLGVTLEPGDILIALRDITNGDQRNDPTYWAIAQTNIDYTNLVSRFNELKTEVEDARGTFASVDERLAHDEQDITAIGTEVSNARGSFVSVDARLEDGEAKQVLLVVGDWQN